MTDGAEAPEGAKQPDAKPVSQDPRLPYLKRARSLLRWSMIVLGMGVAVLILGFILVAVSVALELQTQPIVLVLAIICLVLVGLGVLGVIVFGLLYFMNVFFSYTRYSLRTLLLSILVGATAMAMIVSGSINLMSIGIPLLLTLVLVLFLRIAANDPLMSPSLKDVIAADKAETERTEESADSGSE